MYVSKGEAEMNAVIKKISMKCKTIYRKAGARLKKPDWILPAVLSVILYALATRGIENFNQLLLYDDEFGYWTASAYLTGTDWKSVASGIPYYSYGYGFLILTPIRLLFSSTETMYQASIVANALLLVGSFWIARSMVWKLFGEMNRAALDVICFVVMLYPSNIVFSHIAWAECLLVFLFWVFVWLSMRIIERPSIWNHLGMAVVVWGLYVVHQRSIAVVIATVMVMVWCFAIDKGRRKDIVVFGIVLAVLFVVHKFIKENLIDEYYFNNMRVATNNLDGQTGKLTAIFTGEGFLTLIKSMMGKWFYLFVATLMMAWWGAEALFKHAKEYWKNSWAAVKSHKAADFSKDVQLWYTWLLLAFAGNFMVAAIYMGYGGRNDTLLYGRYNEYMIGIYFVIGVVAFLRDEKWLPKLMVYVLIALACGGFCQQILNEDNVTAYQAYHSICTSLFLEKDHSAQGAALDYAIGGFAFSMLVMMILKAKPWKRLDWVRNGVVILAVVLLFNSISYRMISGVMTDKQCLRIVNIRNVVSWIEAVDEDAEQRVYYCKDTESRYWSESFQFLLKERPLTVISSDEIEAGEDAFYIVGLDFLDRYDFDEKYYCIKRSNQFALVVHANQELAEKARGLSEGQG